MHVQLLLAAAAVVAMAVAPPAEAAPGGALLLAQADVTPPPADPGSGSADQPKKKKRKPRRKKKKADETKPADAADKPAEPPPAEAVAPAAPPAEAPPAAEVQKAPETPPAEPPPAVPPTEPPPPVAPEVKTPSAPAEANPEVVPAQAPPPADAQATTGGEDLDPPNLAHEPVTHAPRGKPLRIDVHVTDPSGVFQVVLFLRKQATADFIPIRFVADKITMGNYTVEVPTALISVPLEYYIETYDTLGNGPARAGSPERPLPIKIDEPIVVVEEPKKIIVPGTPKGAPPSITHSSVPKAYKGKAVEIPARLRGETGVGSPVVKWRQLGDSDYRTLPMGLIGGDQYTATIPASQLTKDIEYYLEATDKYGNGPGRSGGPDAPYLIRVEDEPPPAPPKVTIKETETTPRKKRAEFVPAPFRPNPLRAGAYVVLTASLASLVFAGGEAYGAFSANENYKHTFTYEGRDDASLLKRANEYGSRAKTFAIIGAATAVVATVLLIVFPDYADVVPKEGGSGGDGAVLFRF